MRRDALKIGAALLLGAALAFPAGLWLGRPSETGRPPVMASDPGARQVFSPTVLRDPHFLAQQTRGVEALERHCRATGEMCEEAAKARRVVEEIAGR